MQIHREEGGFEVEGLGMRWAHENRISFEVMEISEIECVIVCTTITMLEPLHTETMPSYHCEQMT